MEHVMSTSEIPAVSRRILATRNAGWARALAGRLARAGVRPNAVSVAGVAWAVLAAAALYVSADLAASVRAVALLLAAVAIQLRLLCNMLDGMLAVEEGLKTKIGDIFNELPDRLSDVVILVGAGYSIRFVAGGPALGWAAALAAVLTAYVRLLGGSLGTTQYFIGPMAKQHRMFTLTLGVLASAAEGTLGMPARAMMASLAVIVVGSVVTAGRRTARILAELRAR
jgi:phosphatidylglycerophosphate synthase